MMRPPEYEILQGRGMANHAQALVYRPTGAEDVSAAVVDATERGLSIAARGAGLSYGDAALNQGGAVIDLGRMNRILEFDADRGIVRAEAGATIEDVWKHVVGSGWWLPVVPGTMKATLGGCVAMNVHGKNHVAAGAFGRHVLGVGLVTGSGNGRSVARGATHAPPAGGPDADGVEELALWSVGLPDVVGAQGLSGTMVDVTLQLKKIHSGYLEVEAEPTHSLPETFQALDRGSIEADYTVAWVDCTGLRAGRGVVHHARYLTPEHPRTGQALELGDQGVSSRLAGVVPRSQAWRGIRPFMSRAGIRALNSGKFRAAALRGGHRYFQSHAAFHFLLDSMPDWKRAYGADGLMQYQLFIPRDAAREAFADALHLQKKTGVHSYLGVMKRHTAEASAATYCLDGYSLALDFPVGRGERFGRLMRLCRALDRIVDEAGGRIYAAKDAVSVGRLPERRDPVFSSNLVRRWERGR
jgi:FAD/FMN-containing dehydrogenase